MNESSKILSQLPRRPRSVGRNSREKREKIPTGGSVCAVPGACVRSEGGCVKHRVFSAQECVTPFCGETLPCPPSVSGHARHASRRGLTWGCVWRLAEKVCLWASCVFFPQFSPLSPDWLPTLRPSPPPPLFPRWPRCRQSRWLTFGSEVRGRLNEGIGRGSSQLKEAFSGEVKGYSATPSCLPPLQWFLFFHRFLLWPGGRDRRHELM